MTFTDFERDAKASTGVMFDDLVTAVGIWIYTNEPSGRDLTIAEAAMVFNTTPALIREAVTMHPWLHLYHADNPDLQVIASDGECVSTCLICGSIFSPAKASS